MTKKKLAMDKWFDNIAEDCLEFIDYYDGKDIKNGEIYYNEAIDNFMMDLHYSVEEKAHYKYDI